MKKKRTETTRNSWSCFGIAGLMAALNILVLVIITNAAHATEFSVSNVTELIDAINNANDEIIHPGSHTINMTKGTYILTEVDNDTNGPNGLPSITNEITINGNDSTIERSEVSETPVFRIFHIDSRGKLLLTDLAVSNGKVTDRRSGGGLYNNGLLKLTTCMVKGNQAGRSDFPSFIKGYGGGLYNHEGDVIIDYCTFSSNQGSHGAGIYNGGRMSIANSSIYENNVYTFGTGGGIDNNGNMTITNSTISGNSNGGGISNSFGTTTIKSSTITGNIGGGIDAPYAHPVEIQNTIIVLNTGFIIGNCTNGGAKSLGHNLVSKNGQCGTDFDLGDIFANNPMLGPLSDNGGPTLTHALLLGSPAIDNGDQAECPKADQRGFLRPVDGDSDGKAICDIGSYEIQLCEGDFDRDGDVDGVDLDNQTNGGNDTSLGDFVKHFGRYNCPN